MSVYVNRAPVCVVHFSEMTDYFMFIKENKFLWIPAFWLTKKYARTCINS